MPSQDDALEQIIAKLERWVEKLQDPGFRYVDQGKFQQRKEQSSQDCRANCVKSLEFRRRRRERVQRMGNPWKALVAATMEERMVEEKKKQQQQKKKKKKQQQGTITSTTFVIHNPKNNTSFHQSNPPTQHPKHASNPFPLPVLSVKTTNRTYNARYTILFQLHFDATHNQYYALDCFCDSGEPSRFHIAYPSNTHDVSWTRGSPIVHIDMEEDNIVVGDFCRVEMTNGEDVQVLIEHMCGQGVEVTERVQTLVE
ncbi:MAG: hypothetical protein Q9213_004002 [Squamulea squamosa]